MCIAGGSSAPAFVADVLGTGVTVAVTSASGLKFRLNPPANHSSVVTIDLQWCSVGEYPVAIAPGDLVHGSTRVAFHQVTLPNGTFVEEYSLDLVDSMASTVTADGNCLHLSAQSHKIDLPTPFASNGLSMSFEPPAGRRRAAGVRP